MFKVQRLPEATPGLFVDTGGVRERSYPLRGGFVPNFQTTRGGLDFRLETGLVAGVCHLTGLGGDYRGFLVGDGAAVLFDVWRGQNHAKVVYGF